MAAMLYICLSILQLSWALLNKKLKSVIVRQSSIAQIANLKQNC